MAAQEPSLDAHASFVIGDKACDVELEYRVGAITFLVRTRYGAQMPNDAMVTPDYIGDDLRETTQVIQLIFASDERGVINGTKR